MNHAKIENGVVVEYPINLRDHLQNVSLPLDLTNDSTLPEGYVFVQESVPSINQMTQIAVEDTPILVDGIWTQAWIINDLPAEQIATNTQTYINEITNKIIVNTQQRLDNFARTKGYDNILSACTYATSLIPQFQSDGQYCVSARDATWVMFHQISDEVAAGTRAPPTQFSDIEAELPVLEWPV